MRARIIRKFGSLVAVLFLVSLASFSLTNLLPGDPTVALLGPGATPESIRALRHDLSLDDPIPVRYGRWVTRAIRGDLGRSYRLNEPVTKVVGRTLPITLELVFLAEMIGLLVGVPVGVMAARRANGRFDKVASAMTFGALAAPQFAVAIVLLLVFAVRLHWFPAVGFVHLTDSVFQNLRSMVLPAATLGLPLAALYARIIRTDMVVTLQQQHVQLARAMGYSERRVVVRHALRQSSLTLLTVLGLQVGTLLGGSLIAENIFALPGMGRMMIERIVSRDYTVVQGGVLLIAAGYVIVNFIVDLLHSMLDPRIRHERVS